MDRLSNLPTPIQIRILTFLPTREAIRTTLLSTQFRYICFSLPKFHFRQAMHRHPEFNLLVDRLLRNHDETNIQSFSLLLHHAKIPPLQFATWIHTLEQHNIRELFFFFDKIQLLPPNLFTCSTLERLILIQMNLELPPTILFPKLKHLCLHRVTFSGGGDDIGNKLISKTTTPVLEELEIEYCDEFFSLSITIPSLKYLGLCTKFVPWPDYAINLSIPSLRELFYAGCPINICRNTLCSLHEAIFELPTVAPYEWPNGPKIFSGMLNVETLYLKSCFLEFICNDLSFLTKELKICPNLKHLHVQMFSTKCHVRCISLLIRSLPALEILHVYGDEEREAREMKYLQTRVEVPCEYIEWTCPLRRIEIDYFRGTYNELDLVRNLFQSAGVLEEMIIRYSIVVDKVSRKMISAKLLALPRASSNVKFLC